MTSTASSYFTDVESGDEAWMGVRVQADTVSLASSLQSAGDLEVHVGKEEAEALRDGLTQALALLST